MAAKDNLCNMALSHLGVGKEIASLDTERSEEAAACRRFYDQVIEETQRDFAWSFTSVIDDLALVSSNPNEEWAYAYRYPSACKRFRRILSGARNDSRQSRVPHRIIKDGSGQLILTDMVSAKGEWYELVTDPTKFPPDYKMAASFLLAFYIAPRVTGGDPFKLGERAGRMYQAWIEKARSNNENEQQPDEEPEAENIRARE